MQVTQRIIREQTLAPKNFYSKLLRVIFIVYNNIFNFLCILVFVVYNYYTFKYYNNINAPTYPQIRLLYKEYFYKRTLTNV